ncbi:MAG: P1 family peptidase [Opitutales bacterium]
MKRFLLRLFALLIAGTATVPAIQGTDTAEPRARDLGIPFAGTPGSLNAITDVAGVQVGMISLVSDDTGPHAARTGVTAILPRGRTFDPVFAGWAVLNGNGEMTGTHWIREGGFLEGPVMITNTLSVGAVMDGVLKWQNEQPDTQWRWAALPVVAETWDHFLNDIYALHVRPEHAVTALHAARGGPVAEGNTGGGTGMRLFRFKGGTGTASRVFRIGGTEHVLGCLVQANFGRRDNLMIAGKPVGRLITNRQPETGPPAEDPAESPAGHSVIVVLATDAPLLPHQLERVARRAGIGVARTGGHATNGSGDLFLAFSTANPGAYEAEPTVPVTGLANSTIDTVFDAAIQATEEAIINALVAAETMTGRNGHTLHAIPHDRLQVLFGGEDD